MDVYVTAWKECWVMMLGTHSGLETLEVGGEDWVRYSWYPTDSLHHLHLVCHLIIGQKHQKLFKSLSFQATAVSVLPSVGCVSCTFHMNSSGGTNSPVEPILEIQSWWPQ